MRGPRTAISLAIFALPALALAVNSASVSAPDAHMEGSAIVTSGSTPETFGVNSNTYVTYTAWDVQPIDSSVTFNFANTGFGQGVSRTGGSNWMKIPIHLPAGSVLTKLEFNYCDSGALDLVSNLFRQPKGASPVFTQVLSSSGTPGCVVETSTLATPMVIDNENNSYNLELYMPATDGTLTVIEVRAGYHLQVSPDPATNTFPNDVPLAHPFHRYIEALAAAGITGGCGVGSYCPDNPVTRGQMAVFLSIALGLHFPN